MWSWIRKLWRLWRTEELPRFPVVVPWSARPPSVIRWDEIRSAEIRSALELGFEKVLRDEFPMLNQLQRDVAMKTTMQSMIADALLGWDKWPDGRERLRVIASRIAKGIEVKDWTARD